MPTPNDQDQKLADEIINGIADFTAGRTDSCNVGELIAAYREQIVREVREECAKAVESDYRFAADMIRELGAPK